MKRIDMPAPEVREAELDGSGKLRLDVRFLFA